MSPRPPQDAVPEAREGGFRLTGEQVGAINRFPDDNPNPVMRVDHRGHLIYANPASAPVARALGAEVGARLAPEVLARIEEAARARDYLELVSEKRTWAVWPVRIRDMDFTNLYGRDVTAERAITKFPDQNPNPVIRIDPDGSLVYANPASAGLLASLGLAIGQSLPARLGSALLAGAHGKGAVPIEVEAGEHTYALLPVDVPEFGFINIYGTDVTAQRVLEKLHRENERLLLNILPEPIADRLRRGETLIADRFEDVTLLFADIVEFTRMSSRLSPDDLVRALNEVFSVFDALVEQHGLEKVKTIGDAYMVVGGLPERSTDHVERVAEMALALADRVASIERAARLGVRFRIGVHCGPVVAGVIGTKKFIYDVWGETVNIASRMESLGVPGRIQVTGAVAQRLGGRFELEPRGIVDVKGIGPMPTWFLMGQTGQRRKSRSAAIAVPATEA